VYVSRSDDNLNHPKQETLGEVIKRKTNKSVGIVTDSEIQDATPAAVAQNIKKIALRVWALLRFILGKIALLNADSKPYKLHLI
ncbi:hypothetical protein, partial [Testudinibacter sp. TR-2022]|uniref:hypothetical protein n=1 Tax=Testudinibacter sp. TR-2022 TaxID=2585029 RepID=UPI00159BA884